MPPALLMMGTLAMAQRQTPAAQGSSSSATTAKPDPTVGQHKDNQQDCIANGVQNGQLTAGKTSNLVSLVNCMEEIANEAI